MTIKKKIYILLSVVTGVLLLQSLLVYLSINVIQQDNYRLKTKIDPLLIESKDFQFNAVQIQQWLTDISATQGKDGLDDGIELATGFFAKAQKNLTELARLDESGKLDYEHVGRLLQVYYSAGLLMAKAYIEGGPQAGNPLMEQFDNAAKNITTAVDVAMNMAAAQKKSLNTDLEKHLLSLENAIYFVFVLNAILIASLLYVLVKQVLTPLKLFQQSAAKLSKGSSDLNSRLHIIRSDEIGELTEDFNRILDKIADMAGQLSVKSATIDTIATKLYSAAGATIDGARSQELQITMIAAALTELSRSSHEVDAGANSIKDQITHSSKQLDKAFNNIQTTEQVIGALARDIQKASGSLTDLQERTNEIGSVLGVIKSIAEQTNLLALNAAIEAARAGEQGRGFAVVADEVRALASRTQESTTEINNIIKQLQDAVFGSINHMANCQKSAVETVEGAKHTLSSIEFVHASMNSISQQTKLTTEAISQQNNVIEEHTQMAHNILMISTKTVELVNKISSDSESLKEDSKSLLAISKSFGG